MRMWDERLDREIAANHVTPIVLASDAAAVAKGATRAGKAAAATGAAAVPGPVHRPRRFAGLLGDLLVWMFLGLSLIVLVLALLARTGSRSGTQWLVVVSNSMWPALRTGDLVAVRPASVTQLRVGDIITFQDSRDASVLVTHRIVRIDPAVPTPVFQVKGDNNPIADPEPVLAARVVGRVGFHLPLVGYLIHMLQARPILALLALLPSVLVLGLQSVRRAAEAEVKSP